VPEMSGRRTTTLSEKTLNLFYSELIISRRIVEIFNNKKNFNHQNFEKGD
jgi:hypothetical protein